MADGPTRSSAAIPLILLGCVGWGGVAAARVLLHWTGGADAALGLAAAVLPPFLAAVTAFMLLRAAPAAEAQDGLAERLEAASLGAAGLQAKIDGLDAVIAGSLAQVEAMTAAAAAQNQGLGAGTTALGRAAAELVNAGQEATRSTDALATSIPDLGRQVTELDAVLRRLGGDTASQLLAVDTVLARAGVRSREAAAEAGAAITALTRQLAVIDERSQEMTDALAKRAYALDAAVDGVLERGGGVVDDIASRLTTRIEALESRLNATRETLEATGAEGARVMGEKLDLLVASEDRLRQLLADHAAHGDSLIERTDRHLADLPERLDAARRNGETALGELSSRAVIVRRDLESLLNPVSASEAALGALGSQLDLLRRVADELGVGLAGRLPATVAELRNLDLGAVALVERIDTVRETMLSAGEATRVLREMVGATRVELAALGDSDARLVGDRLEALIVATGNLGERIAAQRTASEQAAASIETLLDGAQTRLEAAHSDGESRLAAFADRLGGVHGSIAEIADPLNAARKALGDIEAQLEHLGGGFGGFGDEIETRLAATSQALGSLTAEAAGLLDRSDALHQSVQAGAGAVGDAAATFEREQQALAAGAETLAGHFDRARAVLEELRTGTGAAVDDAQSRLGPVFEQAHALAEQGAGALHAMLNNIVSETEAALERVGGTVAETAFAAPIRIQLAAVEDAGTRLGESADAATQRVADQARGLGAAIESVETKLAEMETRIEVRDRDTLSARSARLIEQLGDASIDVAKLLSVDVGDTLAEYMGGDRGAIARRVVQDLDRDSLRKISRHYQHDAEFREEAVRYIDTFERLTRRVLDDPDGEELMATIVSSDLGKLYIAMARGTERWPAGRA